MERLTEKTVGCFEYALKDHKAVPGEFGTYDAFFDYSMAVKRLGHYEDTGLEPEQVMELKSFTQGGIHKVDDGWKHVQDLLQAEQDGRMVVLPCMVGDTVYVIGEKRIMRCGIDEAYLDDKKGLEYLVSFFCDSDCDGCPFNNWRQSYSGEWYCDGEYGQSVVVGSEIGKTVFLTREEAEAAMKEADHA